MLTDGLRYLERGALMEVVMRDGRGSSSGAGFLVAGGVALIIAAVAGVVASRVGWAPDSHAPTPVPAGPPPPADLAPVLERASQIGPLTSFVVSHHGRILAEVYFHGASADEPINVKSASKSVVSALVGIAIAEGALEGTGQRLPELFPDYFRSIEDSTKRAITLGDLLSMRAGLETTSFGTYGAWVESPDWVRFALERPMTCAPGECWEYSTGNTHLLGAAVARATGTDLRAYADRELFGPLGIAARPWDRDPQGYYLGGNNMAFSPRELLRFGELYLNEGVWEGERILPAEWIERSWELRVRSPYNGHGYGLGWWGREVAGEPVRFAWGYGGQYLFCLPELELAVVATTDPGRQRRRWDADRAIFRLLREEVIPRVRESERPFPPRRSPARAIGRRAPGGRS